MKSLILSIIIAASLGSHTFAQDRPTVGAIRWDAWLGESNNVGAAVNQSLGPNQYHWRLPFFAIVLGPNAVNIDGTSQAVADAEIDYAAHSELDYFAFLMYDEDFLLSQGLKNYLTSTKKSMVNFCVIMNDIDVNTEPLSYSVQRTLRYFEEPTYQTVLDDRPLVYTFRLRDNPAFALALKDSCVARGWNEPYIVDLHWTDEMPSNSVYDAICRYWYDGRNYGGSTTGAPYSNLMSAAQTNWELRASNNTKQVPLVSLGADGRPRIDNPVPWIADPVNLYENYFEPPTPQEMITHLGQAFDFVNENPQSCEANTVLMYAWNENDEGGWLMPTLENDTDTNTARIDSLRSFLLTYTFTENPNTDTVFSGILTDTLFGTIGEIGVGSAFDGNIGTYAAYERTGGFCQMEFSKIEEIHTMRYYPRPGFQTRLTNAVFQVSDNGTDWTNVHTIATTPTSGIWTELNFEPALSGKYARLYQATNWLTISEIEFLGSNDIITSSDDLNSADDTFKVWPNPTNGHIKIQYDEIFSVEVLDQNGIVQMSFPKTAQQNTIDISALPNGIYFLKLLSHDETKTTRLIKLQ